MRYAAMGLLLLVAGCAMGIREDGRGAAHDAFHAPLTYQQAYRRADAYARHCHANTSWFSGSFNVNGNLYTDNHTGVVHVTAAAAGGDLERIEVAEARDGGSDITVTVWNAGIWDARELAAARASIETGTLTCRQ